jgi:TRAP-type C4-dicarboxylate transport system substrate-binding protein
MSQKAWDSLSAEDQAIFRAAARESTRLMRTQWQDWERRAREQAQKSGSVVIPWLDKKPFEAAMRPLYDEALRDPAQRSLVERIRQVQ